MWARTLAGGRAVYLEFNSVQRPTPGFLRSLGRLVHGPKVRRVIVDVRLNGGGDNTTYGPLVDLFRSKQVNKRGRLYLLAGRATFSAAANFAAEIDRATRAIVVGEPTGGGVETYGDTFPVTLPTAGWTVHIAARYHERKRGPGDRRLAVEPDVRVELTSAQYFAGLDPVLARALQGALGGRSRPFSRAGRARVVDEVERVAEDQASHVVRLEELSREAGAELAHRGEEVEMLVRQLDVERSEVLAQLRLAAGSHDRNRVPRLRAHPCDGDLRRCGADLLRDGDDLAGEAVHPLPDAVVAARLGRLRSGTSP